MIICWAVAFRTVVSAYTVTPAVSIQLSPCSILVGAGIAVVVIGVAIICGVTGPIFTIVPAVELKLIHDPVKFRFHLAVVLVNLDFQG